MLVHGCPRRLGSLRCLPLRTDLLVINWLVRRLTYWLHIVLNFGVEWFLLFLAHSVDLAIDLAALRHHTVILASFILLLNQLLLFFKELLLERLALLFLRILDLHAR